MEKEVGGIEQRGTEIHVLDRVELIKWQQETRS